MAVAAIAALAMGPGCAAEDCLGRDCAATWDDERAVADDGRDKAMQIVFRGNEGYRRYLSINDAGKIEFPPPYQPQGWETIGGLPGWGTVQASSAYTYGDEVFEYVWRGGYLYSRVYDTNDGIQSAWRNVMDGDEALHESELPGGRAISSFDVSRPTADSVLLSYWKGDEGYYKYVPIDPDAWPAMSSAWDNHDPLTPECCDLPGGGGPIVSQDNIRVPGTDGAFVYEQAFWKDIGGGQMRGWYRSAPIGDAGPDWSTEWRGELTPSSALPVGSGPIRGQALAVVPGGYVAQDPEPDQGFDIRERTVAPGMTSEIMNMSWEGDIWLDRVDARLEIDFGYDVREDGGRHYVDVRWMRITGAVDDTGLAELGFDYCASPRLGWLKFADADGHETRRNEFFGEPLDGQLHHHNFDPPVRLELEGSQFDHALLMVPVTGNLDEPMACAIQGWGALRLQD